VQDALESGAILAMQMTSAPLLRDDDILLRILPGWYGVAPANANMKLAVR
jgi:hypothetical protein